MTHDARRFAPAAARNRVPIAEAISEHLPPQGLVLEIASGSGEHSVFLAERFSALVWQPTDPDPDARSSIEAWRHASGLPNVREPLALDVTEQPWPVDEADFVLNINMIHISPWAASEALMAGASRVLPIGGKLVTYGPYSFGGEHTAPSNVAFDQNLRSRNPAWGVRDLDDLQRAAQIHSLRYEARVAMPANNYCLVFVREND